MSTILTIFAGRKPNLEILSEYLKRAIDANIVDEVHFWNNTRNPQDEEYIRSISNIKRVSTKDAGKYVKLNVSDKTTTFELKATVESTLHVKFRRNNVEYEFAMEGKAHCQSVLKRNGVEVARVWNPFASWAESFDNSWESAIEIKLMNNVFTAFVNNNALMSVVLEPTGSVSDVQVMTEHGVISNLVYDARLNSGFYLMDTCVNSWENYYQYYNHVHFENDIIIKSDDDILFIDLEKLPKFIQYVKTTDNDLVFANTINNGVSAYYQQHKYGLIPKNLMQLEYPEGGLGGTLLGNPKMTTDLHEYFIEHHREFLDYEYNDDIIPIGTRYSINFFGFKGRNWWKIQDCHPYDERLLTVDYVAKRGFKNVLYADMYVAHLSFGGQVNNGLNQRALQDKYKEFCRKILKISNFPEQKSNEIIFHEKSKTIPEL